MSESPPTLHHRNRIADIAAALDETSGGPNEVRIALSGNPPTSRVPDFSWGDPLRVPPLGPIRIIVDPLPGGRLSLKVLIAGRLPQPDPAAKRSKRDIVVSVGKALLGDRMPDLDLMRVEEAERAEGWGSFGNSVTRRFELDPSKPAEVGRVVEATLSVLEIRGVPASAAWHVSVVARHAPRSGASQEPEAWVEAPSAADLRDRIRRLMPLRGGRILARYGGGPSVQVALTTARRGTSIRINATNLGDDTTGDRSPWSRTWIFPAESIDAATVLAGLEESLADLNPDGVGGDLALRFEGPNASEKEGGSAGGYEPVVGCFAVAPLLLVISLFGADLGWNGLLVITRGAAGTTALFLVVLSLFSLYIVAWIAGETGRAVANRLRFRFETSGYAAAVTAFLGCLGYLALLLLAGPQAALVIVAPWLVGIGLLTLPRLGRWLRPN